MIYKIDNAKAIPYGSYRGVLLKKVEDAEQIAKNKDAWLWTTKSPKMILLFIKTTENELFGV